MKRKLLALTLISLLMLFVGSTFASDITSTGWSQNDEYKLLRSLVANMQNRTLSPGNVTAGTISATMFKSTSTIIYTVNGNFYQKSIMGEQTQKNLLVAQASSTYCYYVLSLDQFGTVIVAKGNDSATNAGALLPDATPNAAPFAWAKVRTQYDQTFTFGKSSFTQILYGLVTSVLWGDMAGQSSGNYAPRLMGW